MVVNGNPEPNFNFTKENKNLNRIGLNRAHPGNLHTLLNSNTDANCG